MEAIHEHYLDNAATTMVCAEAAGRCGRRDAASLRQPELHAHERTRGKEAAGQMSQAGRGRAWLCPAEAYFTSCGSESDNWALLSGAEYMKRRGKHIISSTVEHDAIRKSLDELEKRGFEVTRLKPDASGAIPVQSVVDALRDDTILVSLMMVNNETGAVTDISAISRELKRAGSQAPPHTDAVQGFMKVPFRAKTLGADMISISGHKIHAPKGIGALYIRAGLKLKPFIVGGDQESGMRAGTEAMPQIAAFGAASEIAYAGMKGEYRAHVGAASAR